ncbi:hypothetical protein M426DRAFT_71707 [Hypoxylon sp. CI-4A]|nr:hypothetical protein M426DRAFT_71707 [Hypoxylon sp. CI-4A]
MEPTNIPDFNSLPTVPGMPQGCAWGVFDKNEKKDLLGTLNLLTPSVVRDACNEARDEVSISLNWPLDGLAVPPLLGRLPVKHKIIAMHESGVSQALGWDEELHFNTQCSSQWDSLAHWPHQESGLAYNGIQVTREALSAPNTGANATPSLDHWHTVGGLVARGVLIDFKEWAEKHARAEGKTGEDAIFSALDGYRITVEDMETVARDQGVEFRHGDVLILRTGLTEILQAPSSEAERLQIDRMQVSGMHGVAESAKWLWNKHFSAVAADTWSFEALMPMREDGTAGPIEEVFLHPWLLSMFGMPIGELWDLKALSRQCKASGRYSFMLTSAPLNIPGLIASPPNALAIF